MGKLTDQVRADLTESMKARQADRTSTLRMLQAALWPSFGYRQAMYYAICTGFGVMFFVLFVALVADEVLVLLLAFYIYTACKQEWLMLETGGEALRRRFAALVVGVRRGTVSRGRFSHDWPPLPDSRGEEGSVTPTETRPATDRPHPPRQPDPSSGG